VSLKVVIIYREYNFTGLRPGWWGQSWDLRPGRLPPWLWHNTLIKEASSHRVRFRVFHQVHEVHNFQLELCADVWGYVAEYAVQVLRQAVAVERHERSLMKNSPNHWCLVVHGYSTVSTYPKFVRLVPPNPGSHCKYSVRPYVQHSSCFAEDRNTRLRFLYANLVYVWGSCAYA